MKRHFLLISFSLILSLSVHAQTYRKLVGQADSLYKAKNYSGSSTLYQQAFKLEHKKSTDLYNGACSAALAGDKPTAYKLLNLAFSNGWANVDHLKKDTDLESLHNDKQWADLVVKMQKKAAELEAGYDKPLRGELLSILDDDQQIRAEFMAAVENSGFKTPLADSLGRVMQHKDSINLIKISKILDEKGWVGKDKIGAQANQAFFLVIQHADLKWQQKYLPMMREAVKKGNAEAGSLALLEDRVALREGKKQIYGSQIYQNLKNQTYYVAPLEDPDNVDKRRDQVGLGPLAEYVKYWKLTWDAAEYKKKLPELEALSKN